MSVGGSEGGGGSGLTLHALCRGLYSSMVRLLLPRVASGRSIVSPDCIMILCCKEEGRR